MWLLALSTNLTIRNSRRLLGDDDDVDDVDDDDADDGNDDYNNPFRY